jgi:hypothetical protein
LGSAPVVGVEPFSKAEACKSMEIKGYLVALTGIERANGQFSSVSLGLSRYVFSQVQFATSAFKALRVAGVRTWCALVGQSSLAFTESRKCVAGG